MSEVLDSSITSNQPMIERAAAALDRHEWHEAFELLSEADAAGRLAPNELELLAQAAWWVGRLPVAIDARERAYAAAMKSGDRVTAAIAAVKLGHDNLLRNAQPMATAWFNRAEKLIEGMPETPIHGWLAGSRAFQCALTGYVDDGLELAARALDIAMRTADRDLEATAQSCRAVMLISSGRVDEGLAIADEITVAAVAGELEPLTAGGVCCATIGACASIGDWRRAADWTEAQDRWCRREHINGYPGMCRLYRAEIKRIKGDWLGAESEARRASEELAGFVPALVGHALYQIGDLRLRRGDLPGAEEALRASHAAAGNTEPAMSLLRLAQGRIDDAAVSIRRALEQPDGRGSWFGPPGSDVDRLAMLPAQVEIALAAGDAATARAAADELASIAERFTTGTARASAAAAQGAVLLHEGDPAGAFRTLRDAVRLWTELDAPYEAARARVGLAAALSAEGDNDRAVLELQTARSAFERLGAAPDVRAIDDRLASMHDPAASALRGASDRAVRTFVFTDIVDSTRLAEMFGDQEWGRLIRWHDQTIRSLVAEFRGEEIKTTGDGFFLAFEDPVAAIDCAIAIQRRLADAEGYAPPVRIGIHQAEANRVGLDYSGAGVNLAARISGQAAGGEILVSAGTVDATTRKYAEGARRHAELKGIAAPVEVVPIAWR